MKILGYILISLISFVVKSIADWGIERSKKTEKTKLDDYFFQFLKSLSSGIKLRK